MFTRQCYCIRKFAVVLMLFTLLDVSGGVFASQQNSNEPSDLLKMSLEELLEVEVISASRQAQKIGELSVPVSVITAEDIHYSGLMNIPEVLQFSTGMDVLKFNRYSYAVGVRGLHELSSDRVQSLVDGRLMDNAIYGGPEFWNLPILLEDIERIEIIRGPGGAAWGANAFTGAINIITKEPEDVLGVFASTTVSEFGDSYTHIRWGEKQGNWRWRTSVGYEDNKSSEDVLDEAAYRSFTGSAMMDALIGFGNYEARDFSRNWRFDNEAIYTISEATEVSFGAGYSHFESGDFEEMGYFPMEDIRSELIRSFARIDHKFKNGSSGYIQWFGNFQNSNRPNYFYYFTRENSIDGQFNFTPAEGHEVSVGGNFRWTYISTKEGEPEEYVLPDEPYDEYTGGVFVIDRWQTTDRLTIEGQLRGDNYSETQTDWAGRLTALYGLDAKKEHVLRLSTARAFRTPLIALREITVQRVWIPPFGPYAVNLLAADGLDNEHTWSLEAGYTGKLDDGLTLRADTYYQRFENLIGGNIVAPTYYRMENIDGGDSYGAEFEICMTRKQGKLSAWYAYNDFETDRDDQYMRGMLPAKHKAGFTGRLYLPDDWTFNANYKFTDTTPASPTIPHPVGSSNRLDLTVSKKVADGKGELMAGVSDLLDESHDPFIQSDTFTAHETPGRMFFGRVQLRF